MTRYYRFIQGTIWGALMWQVIAGLVSPVAADVVVLLLAVASLAAYLRARQAGSGSGGPT